MMAIDVLTFQRKFFNLKKKKQIYNFLTIFKLSLALGAYLALIRWHVIRVNIFTFPQQWQRKKQASTANDGELSQPLIRTKNLN